MKDQHTITRVALLHPDFRQQTTDFVDELEAFTEKVWRVVQGLRTFSEQTTIYNQGRVPVYDPSKIVTYSPAGASYHNYGIAIDVAPIIFDADNNPVDLDWKFDYHTIRPIAIKHGLTCGMDFPHPDMDHFENKFGLNWRDLLHRYNIKDVIPGTAYVRIK